jgi:hypothetical protein
VTAAYRCDRCKGFFEGAGVAAMHSTYYPGKSASELCKKCYTEYLEWLSYSENAN